MSKVLAVKTVKCVTLIYWCNNCENNEFLKNSSEGFIRWNVWTQTIEMNLSKSPSQWRQLKPFRKISQRRQRHNRERNSGSGHLNVCFLLPSKKEIAHLIWLHWGTQSLLHHVTNFLFIRIHMHVKNFLVWKQSWDTIWGTKLGLRAASCTWLQDQ